MPHHRLWKYILTIDRELIQHGRSLQILSDGPSEPLRCSKLQSEYKCDRQIEEFEFEKAKRQSDLISDFVGKQQTLFEQARVDIEEEVHQHQGTVAINDIAPLIESITQAKIELLKNEMNKNIAVFKSNLEMDVKISKELDTKDKIIASMKGTA